LAAWRGLHSEQDVREVGLWVDAVGLAGGAERVQAGDVCPSLVVSDEEVVLPAEGHRAERAFEGQKLLLSRRRLLTERALARNEGMPKPLTAACRHWPTDGKSSLCSRLGRWKRVISTKAQVAATSSDGACPQKYRS
jgi:hypothetical protein